MIGISHSLFIIIITLQVNADVLRSTSQPSETDPGGSNMPPLPGPSNVALSETPKLETIMQNPVDDLSHGLIKSHQDVNSNQCLGPSTPSLEPRMPFYGQNTVGPVNQSPGGNGVLGEYNVTPGCSFNIKNHQNHQNSQNHLNRLNSLNPRNPPNPRNYPNTQNDRNQKNYPNPRNSSNLQNSSYPLNNLNPSNILNPPNHQPSSRIPSLINELNFAPKNPLVPTTRDDHFDLESKQRRPAIAIGPLQCPTQFPTDPRKMEGQTGVSRREQTRSYQRGREEHKKFDTWKQRWEDHDKSDTNWREERRRSYPQRREERARSDTLSWTEQTRSDTRWREERTRNVAQSRPRFGWTPNRNLRIDDTCARDLNESSRFKGLTHKRRTATWDHPPPSKRDRGSSWPSRSAGEEMYAGAGLRRFVMILYNLIEHIHIITTRTVTLLGSQQS